MASGGVAGTVGVTFRRTTPPDTPYYSARAKHIVWRPVGAEWHAVAGRWDLFRDVITRVERILTSSALRDTPDVGH